MINYKFKFEKVFDLVKKGNYEILVPDLPKKFQFRKGIYFFIHQNIVRKVGLFGNGVKSGSNTRYSTYRTVGKDLLKYIDGTKKSNGSVKSMKTLCEKINIGEKVEVQFVELTDKIFYINGLPPEVSLPTLEQYFKDKHQDTLWLT